MAERREFIEVNRGVHPDGTPFDHRTWITTVAGVQPSLLKRLLDGVQLNEKLGNTTVSAVQQVVDEDLSDVFGDHVPRIRWAMLTWLRKEPSIRDRDTGYGMTYGQLYEGLTATPDADGQSTIVAMRILQQIVATGGSVAKHFDALVPKPLPQSIPPVAEAPQAVPEAVQLAPEDSMPSAEAA